MGDAGAQALGRALTVNTKLSRIDLYSTLGFTFAVQKLIIVDSAYLPLDQELMLAVSHPRTLPSDNEIGDAGAQALADALKTNASRTSFGLTSKLQSFPSCGLITFLCRHFHRRSLPAGLKRNEQFFSREQDRGCRSMCDRRCTAVQSHAGSFEVGRYTRN